MRFYAVFFLVKHHNIEMYAPPFQTKALQFIVTLRRGYDSRGKLIAPDAVPNRTAQSLCSLFAAKMTYIAYERDGCSENARNYRY